MFKFKGISSQDMQVVVEEEEHFLARAAQRYEIKEIEGKDGAEYNELGYSVVERPIYIQCLNINKIDDILAWLNGEGEFEYKGRKTIARFYSVLEPKRSSCIRIIDTNFIRDPFWYKANEQFSIIKDRKDKSASGENITINDSSNMPFKEFKIGGNDYQATSEASSNILDPNRLTLGYINLDTGALEESNTTYPNSTYTPLIKLNTDDVLRIFNSPSAGQRIRIYNLDGTYNSYANESYYTAATDCLVRVLFLDTINADTSIKINNTNSTYEEFTPDMPSPKYESPVRACGDNINYYNKDAETTTKYISDTGTIETLNGIATLQIIEPKFTHYVMSYKSKVGDGYVRMAYYNEDTFISREYSSTNKKIFTVPNNCTKIDVRVDASTTVYFSDLKIEGGEVASTYSPYGRGSICLKKTNENIINLLELSFGTSGAKFQNRNINSIELINLGTWGNVWFYVENLKSNTEYNVSAKFLENIATSVNVGFSVYGNSSKSTTNMTTIHEGTNIAAINKNVQEERETVFNTANYKCIIIRIWGNWSATSITEGNSLLSITDIMLKEGREKSKYIEHQSKEYIIPIQQIFYKGDDFVKVDGKRYERHNKSIKIFDGTENISLTSNGNSFRIYVTDILKNTNTNEKADLLSNMYVVDTWNNRNTNNSEGTFAQYSDSIGFDKGDFETVDEFKAHLAELFNKGTPLYIVYPLAEAIYIKCTEEQNAILDEIDSDENYKNTTIVYSEDEISPLFDIEYIAITDEKILNEGNLKSRPILRLEKTISNEVELTINNCRFRYNFEDDSYVEIDCEKKTIMYEGLERNRNIKIGYDFPKLETGKNDIIMHEGDCIIKIFRKDRWL